jgi:hypothetical protein
MLIAKTSEEPQAGPPGIDGAPGIDGPQGPQGEPGICSQAQPLCILDEEDPNNDVCLEKSDLDSLKLMITNYSNSSTNVIIPERKIVSLPPMDAYNEFITKEDGTELRIVLPRIDNDSLVFVPYELMKGAGGVSIPILGEYGVGYIGTYTDENGNVSYVRKLIRSPEYKLEGSPVFKLSNGVEVFFPKAPIRN